MIIASAVHAYRLKAGRACLNGSEDGIAVLRYSMRIRLRTELQMFCNSIAIPRRTSFYSITFSRE
jgi:hypothetical protein